MRTSLALRVARSCLSPTTPRRMGGGKESLVADLAFALETTLRSVTSFFLFSFFFFLFLGDIFVTTPFSRLTIIIIAQAYIDLQKIELNDEATRIAGKLKDEIQSLQKSIKDDIRRRKELETNIPILFEKFQRMAGPFFFFFVLFCFCFSFCFSFFVVLTLFPSFFCRADIATGRT